MKKFTALFKPLVGVSLGALLSACAGNQAEAEEPPMDVPLETENEPEANSIQQDPVMGDEEVQLGDSSLEPSEGDGHVPAGDQAFPESGTGTQ